MANKPDTGGYAEAAEGTACNHEHGDDCYTEVTSCAHEHDAACYPADVQEPSACAHICSADSGCVTKEANK